MTLPKTYADGSARRATALADPTRRAVLGHLEAGPTDVRTLAARIGVHENSVRQHLAVLRAAGMIVEELERQPGRAGRPRTVYRAADGAMVANPFERLAVLLAQVAAGGDVVEVGEAEGARLGADWSDRDPADAVAMVARQQGFAVEVERGARTTRVALTHCPFESIANPVVCALHRAVAAGTARAAGTAVTRFVVADPPGRPCELTLASGSRRRTARSRSAR